MMKKMNKKGFTIVELVIVIAVIAILAAVMIPTFTGLIDKANESNALATAKNAYTALLIADKDANISDTKEPDAYIKVTVSDDTVIWFSVEDGELKQLETAPAIADGANAPEGYAAITATDIPSNAVAYLPEMDTPADGEDNENNGNNEG